MLTHSFTITALTEPAKRAGGRAATGEVAGRSAELQLESRTAAFPFPAADAEDGRGDLAWIVDCLSRMALLATNRVASSSGFPALYDLVCDDKGLIIGHIARGQPSTNKVLFAGRRHGQIYGGRK